MGINELKPLKEVLTPPLTSLVPVPTECNIHLIVRGDNNIILERQADNYKTQVRVTQKSGALTTSIAYPKQYFEKDLESDLANAKQFYSPWHQKVLGVILEMAIESSIASRLGKKKNSRFSTKSVLGRLGIKHPNGEEIRKTHDFIYHLTHEYRKSSDGEYLSLFNIEGMDGQGDGWLISLQKDLEEAILGDKKKLKYYRAQLEISRKVNVHRFPGANSLLHKISLHYITIRKERDSNGIFSYKLTSLLQASHRTIEKKAGRSFAKDAEPLLRELSELERLGAISWWQFKDYPSVKTISDLLIAIWPQSIPNYYDPIIEIKMVDHVLNAATLSKNEYGVFTNEPQKSEIKNKAPDVAELITKIEKKMSVPELAEKIGCTKQCLYQARTRKKASSKIVELLQKTFDSLYPVP